MFLGPCLGKRKFYETVNPHFACDKGIDSQLPNAGKFPQLPKDHFAGNT